MTGGELIAFAFGLYTAFCFWALVKMIMFLERTKNDR